MSKGQWPPSGVWMAWILGATVGATWFHLLDHEQWMTAIGLPATIVGLALWWRFIR